MVNKDVAPVTAQATKTTGLTGINAFKIIADSIYSQRVAILVAMGYVDEARADSTERRLDETKAKRAALIGRKYLVETGKDAAATHALVAFKITEEDLASVKDLKIPEELRRKIRAEEAEIASMGVDRWMRGSEIRRPG